MGRGLSDGGENRPLGIPTAAEDFPIVSRVQRVLGWCLWLGIPVVVGVGGTAAFLLTGWPPAAVGVVLVLPVGMIAVVLVLRRYGGNATGWDDQAIRFERSGKPEVVAWDAVEYFRKLWRTGKLDGNAWVVVVVKYRTVSGSRCVFLTVSGTVVVESLPLFPAYETVFDRRIPERNEARNVTDSRQNTV